MNRSAVSIVIPLLAIALSGLASPSWGSVRPTATPQDPAAKPAVQIQAPSSAATSRPLKPAAQAAAQAAELPSDDGGGEIAEDPNVVATEATIPRNGDLTAAPDSSSNGGKVMPPWWLIVLVATAGVFGLVGTFLGLASMRARAAVKSVLGSSSLSRSGDHPRNDRLSDQVLALLGHVRRMRDRITALEGEVQRLTAEKYDADRSAKESAFQRTTPSRSVDFFESARDDHHFDEERVGRGAAPATWTERTTPPAPMPPARVFADHNSAIEQLWHYPEVRDILEEYNRAASLGDRAALADFERRHLPVAVAPVGDGSTLVRGGDDLLWFVPLKAAGDFGFVVPGPGPIKNWHKIYRTMLGQQAKERFGTLYEVVEGPELTIDTPAWAQEVDGAYSRLRAGRLRGAMRN